MDDKQFNILFVTQDDPFYIKIFFEEFLKNYEAPQDVKALVISKTMGDERLADFIKRVYGFYGFYDFVRMGMRYTFSKSMNYLSRTFTLQKFYSIERLCEFHHIPVIHHNNINDEHFLQDIKAYDLDLIISVAAPVIFKKEIISLPRFGCINIHHAKLPRYRGMMPNFWQMYHGNNTAGITIHKINPKIDDGEIILQREVEIQRQESLDSLIKRTKKIGAALMIEAIAAIKKGDVPSLPNDSSMASYHSFPTKDDVKKFKGMGYKLL
jgi:methionyl-tRNA formyltransferase